MLSRDNIETYRIDVDLPIKEEKANIVEQFISKYPLSSLKPDSDMKDITVLLNKTLSLIPTLVLSGSGASLSLSKKSLVLRMEKEKAGAKKVEVFLDDNLNKVSSDFNFIIAGILGLLNVESLKAEENFKVVKPLGDGVKLDYFFNQNFWNKLTEYGETHVSGLQIEFNHALMGCDVPHEIVLRREKKEIWGIVSCYFDIRGPMDIGSVVNNRLKMVDALYLKLLENA